MKLLMQIVALLTWGPTSSVLGISSFLKKEGLIAHATYMQLRWLGGLGLASAIAGAITSVVNAFAVNEPQAQQQQPPAAP